MNFLGSLRTCLKGSIRYLSNLVYSDRRTLVGKTVSKIALECKVERSRLTKQVVKNMEYFPPPPGDEWKIGFLQELIKVRDGLAVVPGISQDEVRAIIDEICCN